MTTMDDKGKNSTSLGGGAKQKKNGRHGRANPPVYVRPCVCRWRQMWRQKQHKLFCQADFQPQNQ